MSAMASQITSLKIVYSTVYSRRRSKKTTKLGVIGLCEGNSPVTGEFPAQRASNAENVSIWWGHHAIQMNISEANMCNTRSVPKQQTHQCSVGVIKEMSDISHRAEQSGRSPKVVAPFLLQTLVAIWYDFFNSMIQSKWNQIIQESTII